MKKALVVTFLLFSSITVADAGVADAGTIVMESESIVAPAPVAVNAGVIDVMPSDPVAAAAMVKTVFVAVKDGNWWLAAAGLLLIVVGFFRTLGRKFHDWLPDNNVLDKPLIFLYDTRVGGWILNWLTAIAGGVGTAMAAGVAVDWSLWKSVLMVSTSASALFELYKDIKAWIVSRTEAKKKAAEEDAAKKAATVAPPAEPPKT